MSDKSAFQIDWEEQWKLHAGHFHEGMVRLPLNNGKTVLMKPGPGFGDLSHPTTLLVLEMMTPFVSGQNVIDIGSGSGILSLAAALLGANEVYGIEIEKDAIEHAQDNAVLNQLKNVQFLLPKQFQLKNFEGVVLVNMIMSEQKEAFKILEGVDCKGVLFASGILKEHRNEYVVWMEKKGWKFLKEQEKQGWLGLSFQSIANTRPKS